MTNVQPKVKSRDLSNYEFLQVLQVECIVAELRSKIYFKHKDKEYWKKVKEGKKKKIEDISERNGLPTIFSDEGLKKEIESKVYNNNSLPNFVYTNAENKRELEYFDLIHYFNKGSDVRVDDFGTIKVGKITEYKPFFTSITVILEGGEKLVTTIDKVTRIL